MPCLFIGEKTEEELPRPPVPSVLVAFYNQHCILAVPTTGLNNNNIEKKSNNNNNNDYIGRNIFI